MLPLVISCDKVDGEGHPLVTRGFAKQTQVHMEEPPQSGAGEASPESDLESDFMLPPPDSDSLPLVFYEKVDGEGNPIVFKKQKQEEPPQSQSLFSSQEEDGENDVGSSSQMPF